MRFRGTGTSMRCRITVMCSESRHTAAVPVCERGRTGSFKSSKLTLSTYDRSHLSSSTRHNRLFHPLQRNTIPILLDDLYVPVCFQFERMERSHLDVLVFCRDSARYG